MLYARANAKGSNAATEGKVSLSQPISLGVSQSIVNFTNAKPQVMSTLHITELVKQYDSYSKIVL